MLTLLSLWPEVKVITNLNLNLHSDSALVVVANIQTRTLKTEGEKGSM